MLIAVLNNNVGYALKLLKRRLVAEGIWREMRDRGEFESRSERRRRKRARAVQRRRKRERTIALLDHGLDSRKRGQE